MVNYPKGLNMRMQLPLYLLFLLALIFPSQGAFGNPAKVAEEFYNAKILKKAETYYDLLSNSDKSATSKDEIEALLASQDPAPSLSKYYLVKASIDTKDEKNATVRINITQPMITSSLRDEYVKWHPKATEVKWDEFPAYVVSKIKSGEVRLGTGFVTLKLVKEDGHWKVFQNIKKKVTKKSKSSKGATDTAKENDLGMWKIGNYVDAFGDATKQGYIGNRNTITGQFSNTATQGSALDVSLLFTSHDRMSIQLYEYGSNNPVKHLDANSYTVMVKSADGSKHKLQGVNRASDRLTLDKESAGKLHRILKSGGAVQFVIRHDFSGSEYNFVLLKSDGYYSAYKKLHKIK